MRFAIYGLGDGMFEKDRLRPSSVLFWLAAIIALGIIFIGARFVIDPLAGAQGFGVPADGVSTFAYLWAKGARDVVSGLLLIALLWLGVSRVILATFIYVAALIPLADLVNVYVNTRAPGALMIHGGTAVFMIVLASLIVWGRDTHSSNTEIEVRDRVA